MQSDVFPLTRALQQKLQTTQTTQQLQQLQLQPPPPPSQQQQQQQITAQNFDLYATSLINLYATSL